MREAVRVVRGQAMQEGAGVRIARLLGTRELQTLDPFLMLDHFDSADAADYLAGFPDHPHRGFETVTYMLEGRMRHSDNKGHSGVIESGGVQWMRAGRGIVHSEMPEQESGRMRGFQLWVNLPARLKMSAPGYQEFPAARMGREWRADDVGVVAIAGTTSRGTAGPVAAPCLWSTRARWRSAPAPRSGPSPWQRSGPATSSRRPPAPRARAAC
jgi:redox-sensitive bicupin YhaK (pirin superfamily)